MLDYEETITDLKAEIDQLKQERSVLQHERDAAKTENTHLKRQLERMNMHNEAINGPLLQERYDAIIERLQLERDKALTDSEAFRNVINYQQKFLPMEVIATPPVVEDKEQALRLLNDPHAIETTLDSVVFVGCTVVVRYGLKPQDIEVIKARSPFPGTKHEALNKIGLTLQQVIARAPLLQELAKAGLLIDENVLMEVLRKLAVYRYDGTLRPTWPRRLKEAFEKFVWKEIEDGEFTRDEAYNRFRKACERSFEKAEKS